MFVRLIIVVEDAREPIEEILSLVDKRMEIKKKKIKQFYIGIKTLQFKSIVDKWKKKFLLI